MKVSVIIPVYNAEAYVREALQSVLAQSLGDIEAICIDDGSTDASRAILSEFAGRDARVKVVAQVNSGLGAARNRGLEEASGEYVHFLDADDALAVPEALERLVREAESENLDALLFDAETRAEEGVAPSRSIASAESYVRKRDYSGVRAGREMFADMLAAREYSPSPCLVLLRRAFLENAGIRFASERIYHEDNIFMTHVLLAAARTGHRPWRFYSRRIHAGSIVTSKPTMRHLRGYLACYLDACALLAQYGDDRLARRILRDRIAIYKLHVRRIADAFPALAARAKEEMSATEYAAFRDVLEYPVGEKIANAFRCLRENGPVFTLKRIFFGRAGA